MIEIIQWQASMEKGSQDFYENTAAYFSKDKDFSDFLLGRAKEEEQHYNLMKKAEKFFLENEMFKSDIKIDEKFRENFERPFNEITKKLQAHTLKKDEAIDFIINVELFEFNNIFIYITRNFLNVDKIFQNASAIVQTHINNIKNYLNKFEKWKIELDRLEMLPKLWEKTILIVDDDEMIVRLLSSVLSRKYKVETSLNGADALDKLHKVYFDAILCDIDMPKMDGWELYGRLLKEDADICKNFIFHTGSLTSERINFLKENNTTYIEKPTSITNIINNINKKIGEID